jgi:8-oxo-dGTP pyrophosphatase MutT (NUDIX family)
MIKAWPTISSRLVGDYRVFRLRADLKVSPRTGKPHDFFVLEGVNWVNVIALTPEHQLVLVEQFRHGTNTVELEIPGGLMDANETSPVTTGVRELREETGYEGTHARVIGEVYANPAIMSNTCYTIQVDQCERKHSVEFDHSEDLITRLVPVEQIPQLVASGRIKHSLVAAALYHFELSQRFPKAIHAAARNQEPEH